MNKGNIEKLKLSNMKLKEIPEIELKQLYKDVNESLADEIIRGILKIEDVNKRFEERSKEEIIYIKQKHVNIEIEFEP